MIKRLKIQDFKSIKDLDLALDPITVLVGRSGTGKSNVMQAIRFLRNYILTSATAFNDEGGWDRIVPAGKKNPQMSVEVIFSLPGEGLDYSYRIGFAVINGPPGLIAEKLTLGNSVLYSRLKRRAGPTMHQGWEWGWEKEPALASVPADFLNTDGPILGFFPALQNVVYAYAALSTGIGYYHFPSSALKRFGDLNDPEQGLSDDGSNYLKVIAGITKDFHNPSIRKSLLATLRSLNSSITSVEVDSLQSPTRAVVGHDFAGRTIELQLAQESDGLRRFYAHLLALYQVPAKLTLVFEEPENAIFAGALSLLADEFKAAPREHRGQVILTTHNATLLDSFEVENIRAVEMRNGETFVGLVSKEQRDAIKERLMTPGELLTTESPRIDDPLPAQPAA